MIYNESEILVSVCIVTYNQEKYIAECLEGVLAQKTNFSFEIVIGEDCSTDNTRVIIQDYIESYPNLIVPIFHEKNVGAVENIKQVYKKARGKYIAHIDGDDLALPGKLQKQFDILEKNQSCNVCTHNAFRVDQDGNKLNNHIEYKEGVYTLLNLFEKLPFFTHSTKMFRNKYSVEFWDRLLCNKNVFDTDLHIENTIDGNIYHLNDKLLSYRVGSGITNKNGVYNKLFTEAKVRGYQRGIELFRNDKDSLRIVKYYYSLSMLQQAYNYAVYNNDIAMFRFCVKRSLEVSWIGYKQLIFVAAMYCPKISFFLFRKRNNIRAK